MSVSPISEINSHPDNEDVLLINIFGPTKPLIFVFAKYPRQTMEDKIASDTISHEDFIALEIPFNDPGRSFFTVNKDFMLSIFSCYGGEHVRECLSGRGG